jgi:hypothetical protein
MPEALPIAEGRVLARLRIHRAFRSWRAVFPLMVLLAGTAVDALADPGGRTSCTCPLGYGNWMLFED